MIDKFTPNTIGGFVGNRALHEQLRDELKNSRNVYITGNPGSGKTSAVYTVAKELGYTVVETNASDERRKDELEKILRMCKLPSLTGERLIILLDEVDGISAWGTVKEILKHSRHPVALTANEDKVSDDVKKLVVHIKLKRPRINEVTEHLKFIALKTGVQGDFSKISRDIRSSITSLMYNSDTYEEESIFTDINNLFTQGKMGNLDKKDMAWLISNARLYLSGVELCDFFELLDVASRSNMLVLENTSVSNRGTFPQYPSYYRKIAAYKRRNKKGMEEGVSE